MLQQSPAGTSREPATFATAFQGCGDGLWLPASSIAQESFVANLRCFSQPLTTLMLVFVAIGSISANHILLGELFRHGLTEFPLYL